MSNNFTRTTSDAIRRQHRTIPNPRPLTEKQWQQQVIDLAELRRWKWYHTYDSRRSPAGFLDLVLIRPPRIVFAELKTDSPRSKATEDQQQWLMDLQACRLEAYLWRPSDFDQVKTVLW